MCNNDYIIRCDADDLNDPERFSFIHKKIVDNGLHVLGSYLKELNEGGQERIREVPLCHRQIIKTIVSRNPFNHQTVIFDGRLAKAIGGYPDIPYKEDYGLWLKMVAAGASMQNVERSLVTCEFDERLVQRRERMVWRSEISLLKLKLKCLGRAQFVKCIFFTCVRILFLKMPVRFKILCYRKLRTY